MYTIFVPFSGKDTQNKGVWFLCTFQSENYLWWDIFHLPEDNFENVLVATFYANWFQQSNLFSLVDSRYNTFSNLNWSNKYIWFKIGNARLIVLQTNLFLAGFRHFLCQCVNHLIALYITSINSFQALFISVLSALIKNTYIYFKISNFTESDSVHQNFYVTSHIISINILSTDLHMKLYKIN